jgi:hypothetical protein
MKEAVEEGFDGYFAEIDARFAVSREMNPDLRIDNFPQKFFEKYFNYLKKEQPSLVQDIKSPEELKKILIKSSLISYDGIATRTIVIVHQGKRYSAFPYVSKEGQTSFEPTFYELGKMLFSDALAAIKLHLIAELMADGHMEKGLIIDYIGTDHLPSKTFFLKYPQYAMEVVLRTIHELMAEKIKEFPDYYQIFQKPNWEEVVRKIFKLSLMKPEPDKTKPVKERKLLNYSINFLKTYNLDPTKIMPSNEEIERIKERLQRKVR